MSEAERKAIATFWKGLALVSVREGQQRNRLDESDGKAQQRDHQEQNRPGVLLDGEQAGAEQPRDVGADRKEQRQRAIRVGTRALTSQVASHDRTRNGQGQEDEGQRGRNADPASGRMVRKGVAEEVAHTSDIQNRTRIVCTVRIVVGLH